jgi:hypothetical protein
VFLLPFVNSPFLFPLLHPALFFQKRFTELEKYRHEDSRSSSPFAKGKTDSRSPPRIDS